MCSYDSSPLRIAHPVPIPLRTWREDTAKQNERGLRGNRPESGIYKLFTNRSMRSNVFQIYTYIMYIYIYTYYYLYIYIIYNTYDWLCAYMYIYIYIIYVYCICILTYSTFRLVNLNVSQLEVGTILLLSKKEAPWMRRECATFCRFEPTRFMLKSLRISAGES